MSLDKVIITRTLVGLAMNPNVGGVVLVGLGCEGVQLGDVLQQLPDLGDRIGYLKIHEEGGMDRSVAKGKEIVSRLTAILAGDRRSRFPISKLKVGIKCGSSDATSGIAANPTVGSTVDMLIDEGATVVFGETTEYIGAEHILVKRALNEAVGNKILEIVDRMEQRIVQVGGDVRGTQPSPGNILGGITSLEEKSLGAISKSGSKKIRDVVEYAEIVSGPGLYIMDSPGKEDEYLTGVAASGVNMCIFTTGGGAPQGFPIMPVIKVASNPHLIDLMQQHIDVDASPVFTGEQPIGAIGDRIFKFILDVASGRPVAAETNRYNKTIGIYTVGPTI